MINKKGLSNIVATVLIILLAIAAVAIVWSFIQPTIRGTASEADLANTCFNTEVAPVSCDTANNQNQVTVQLKRGTQTNIAEIVAVVTHVDGTTITQRTNTIPDVLETMQFTGWDPAIVRGDKVKAAAVVKDPNNPSRTRACDLSIEEVTCA